MIHVQPSFMEKQKCVYTHPYIFPHMYMFTHISTPVYTHINIYTYVNTSMNAYGLCILYIDI